MHRITKDEVAGVKKILSRFSGDLFLVFTETTKEYIVSGWGGIAKVVMPNETGLVGTAFSIMAHERSTFDEGLVENSGEYLTYNGRKALYYTSGWRIKMPEEYFYEKNGEKVSSRAGQGYGFIGFDAKHYMPHGTERELRDWQTRIVGDYHLGGVRGCCFQHHGFMEVMTRWRVGNIDAKVDTHMLRCALELGHCRLLHDDGVLDGHKKGLYIQPENQNGTIAGQNKKIVIFLDDTL